MSSPRVTHFFKAAVSDVSLLLAAKEATSAYLATNYGQSFKSSDCNFWTSFKLFEPKLATAKTKCESVVINCIAPMIAAELRQLHKLDFVSVTVDASKRK